MTHTATSGPLALVAYAPQTPRLQSFASASSPVLALQWSLYSSTRELGSARGSYSIHKDVDLLDGAHQAVVSCLREPRREGRRWWYGSLQNERKTTRQHVIWRTKAERKDSLAVESEWEREEARWLREEQRWLREEERWRREEARWTEERKAWAQESLAMAEEIKALKQEMEQLLAYTSSERSTNGSLSNVTTGLSALLEYLQTSEFKQVPIMEKKHVLHTASSFTVSSSEADTVSEEENNLATHSTASMSDFSIDLVHMENIASASTSTTGSGRGLEPKSTQSPTRRALKRGAGGAEVRSMQEALARLGYYSGDEEIEYSSFSTGTEAAVKAWQVSVGAVDDGIMSIPLLAQLAGEENPAIAVSERKKPNGQASTPKQTAGSSEMKHMEQEREMDCFSTTDDETGLGSRTRVYLLGENRWEDSSRLIQKSKGPTMNSKTTTVLCFSCRGEGVTLCTECEGTGDLNVEEQFLEWVEEGAKCPYCEGSGSVSCDVCLGSRALRSS